MKKYVSIEKLHRVLHALDKHFSIKDWSFTLRKDDKDRCRVVLCWRVVRPSKTIFFSLRSFPLLHVPAWAYYAVIYRFEKVKELCKHA